MALATSVVVLVHVLFYLTFRRGFHWWYMHVLFYLTFRRGFHWWYKIQGRFAAGRLHAMSSAVVVFAI